MSSITVLSHIALIITFVRETSALPEECASSLCVTRCCPDKMYMFKLHCKPNQLPEANASVYSEDLNRVLDVKVLGIYDYNLNLRGASPLGKNAYLLKDGTLLLVQQSENKTFPPEDFCIIHKKLSRNAAQYSVRYLALQHVRFIDYFIITGWLLSSVCLGLVLLVYALLKELRNLRGLVLMSCLASLMTSFVVLTVLTIANICDTSTLVMKRVCVLVIYYSTLSCHFWMNTMSFDIWWTFRGIVQVRAIHRRGELCKYLIYCAYAWGVPLLMTASVEILDRAVLPQSFVKPGIQGGNYFAGKSIRYYVYVPLLVLLLSNLVLFVLTVINISHLNRDSGRLSNNVNSNKNRFGLYVKLFVVMGLNWFMEILAGQYDLEKYYFTDICNVLTGVVIFLVFVCNRNTWRKLVARYYGKVPHASYRSRSRSESTTEVSNLGQGEGTALQAVSSDPRDHIRRPSQQALLGNNKGCRS